MTWVTRTKGCWYLIAATFPSVKHVIVCNNLNLKHWNWEIILEQWQTPNTSAVRRITPNVPVMWTLPSSHKRHVRGRYVHWSPNGALWPAALPRCLLPCIPSSSPFGLRSETVPTSSGLIYTDRAHKGTAWKTERRPVTRILYISSNTLQINDGATQGLLVRGK